MPSTARKNTLLPRAIGQVVVLPTPTETTSLAQIKTLAFWSKLNPAEQDQLSSETTHLLTAQQQLGLTAVEVGQRLLNVQRMLTPFGGFKEYLERYFRKSERTAYRYITDYVRLLDLFGRSVVEAMIRSSFELGEKGDRATRDRPLGQYTEAYLKLLSNKVSPPNGASEEEALRWVRQLQIEHERLKVTSVDLSELKTRVETPSILPPAVPNYQELLRRNFLDFQASLQKIPVKRTEEFIESFVGYILAHRGVISKAFTAQAIPTTFKRAGRPSHNKGWS